MAGSVRSVGAAGCLAAAAALLVSGCTSSGGGSGNGGTAAPSTFAAALAATPSTSWDGSYFEFGDSTIGTKLSGLGFKQDGSADGGTLWVISAAKSGENNPTNDPELDVLDVSADRIVLGDSTADVEAIMAASTNALGSNATLAALASCLGSAKAGLIGSSPIVVRLTARPARGARIGTLLTDYDSPYVEFSDLIDQGAS